MSTNILYLSYDGMTDSLGQSQVLPYLKRLTKQGFRFHIISFEKKERFQRFEHEIQSICYESQILWYPLIYTKKPPVLSTVYDVIRMHVFARKLHQEFHFKLVHCRSYLPALIGMKMKKDLGLKLLFDMRGFWPDERVEGKIWNLNKPIYKFIYNFFKRKEKQLLFNSDAIVSLTNAGKKEIVSWNGFEKLNSKIVVIPCCVDLDKFNPSTFTKEQKSQTRKNFGFTNSDFILGYVGSIGTWYMLDEMLLFFKALIAKKNNSKFLFISGENPNTIYERAKQFGISKDLIYVKSVFHSEVALNISIFDASVFFIIPTFSKKASSPTKQGELMAMGIPIYCNDNIGDTSDIIQTYKAGKVVSIEKKDFNKIVFNLDEFDKNFSMLGAKEFYGIETGVNSYLKLYNSLIYDK